MDERIEKQRWVIIVDGLRPGEPSGVEHSDSVAYAVVTDSQVPRSLSGNVWVHVPHGAPPPPSGMILISEHPRIRCEYVLIDRLDQQKGEEP